MTNIDVILSSVDLDVFGGPASLDVSTDFGRAGERGSKFFAGQGDPQEQLPESLEILLYDLYINQNPLDEFYGWLYQYLPSPGGAVWTQILKLNPSQYSKIQLVSFADGIGTIQVPTTLITADTLDLNDKSKLIIRYSIEDTAGNPIASSFAYTIQTVNTVDNLVITVNAAQLSGEAWSLLDGSYNVHIFVSYIS